MKGHTHVAVKMFVCIFGVAAVAYVQVSISKTSYAYSYIRSASRLLVTPDTHVFQTDFSNHSAEEGVDVDHIDSPIEVVSPTSCIQIPGYCTEDKRVPWPECSVSGVHLPQNESLCRCSTNPGKQFTYDEFIRRSVRNGIPRGHKSDIPVFFINMDRSTDRRDHFYESFRPIFSSIHRFSAVNASSQLVKRNQKLYKAKDEHIMAVLLSHMGVIKKALEHCETHNKTHAIIMEDDTSLIYYPFWRNSIDKVIDQAPKDWLSIQLGYSRSQFIEDVAAPQYHTISADSQGRKRTKEHFRTGFWKSSEWGAFAYAVKVEGMRKLLQRSMSDMKRSCSSMTSDDCFLGFTPNHFVKSTPLYQHNYLAVPPLFGITVDAGVTHRKSKDRVYHHRIAAAGNCMSLHDNIWYFNNKMNAR